MGTVVHSKRRRRRSRHETAESDRSEPTNDVGRRHRSAPAAPPETPDNWLPAPEKRSRRARSDDSGSRASDVSVSRAVQKQRTRALLMDAALQLMSSGRSYTSLGLREITREAGVVPTSFYRHFADLDELGLALVEETGLTLRRLLREARRSGVPPIRIIDHSVRIYRQFVREHRLHILFMASERWGGSPLIRRSIRYETQHFATEMAQDLRELNLLPGMSMSTLQMVCGLVVNTMLNAASDFIDVPADQPQIEEELTQNFVLQLRVIFLGATQWRDER
jgi:TetR/AcrR family transcriptional regulator, fatty acid biosynthesis regulator